MSSGVQYQMIYENVAFLSSENHLTRSVLFGLFSTHVALVSAIPILLNRASKNG